MWRYRPVAPVTVAGDYLWERASDVRFCLTAALLRWLPRSSVVAQAKALCACSGCARHAQRTQSVLGGIPTQSVRDDQLSGRFRRCQRS